jgi:acetoin utilization protein AcuB
MSFFLSTKGTLHPYNFKYLNGEFERARMEPTLISGHKKEEKNAQKKEDFFAIDVMSHPVRKESVDTPLDDIRDLMKKHNIRHIPIIENKKFVGLVSDRDLLKLDMSGTFAFLTAKDIMTTVVVVAHENTPLAHVARVLLEEKISAIPIIDDNHHLTGIVSRSDILKAVIYNQLVMKLSS